MASMNSGSPALATTSMPSDGDAHAAAVSVGGVEAQSVAAPNLLLIGGAAGVLTGVLELGYAVSVSSGPHIGSLFMLLGVTCSLMGFCGLIYGAALEILSRFSTARVWLPLKLLVVLVAGVAAATRYKPFNAVVIGAALFIGLLWVWWRSSTKGCAVVFAWACLLYVLSPLFNGHAMDRVFTDLEGTVVFLAVVCLLPGIAFALLSATVGRRAAPTRVATVVVKAGAAAASAAILTICSSVFLVRLWGFNTMAYLEATLLALKIGCLATSLTVVCAFWPMPAWRRPRRESNLIAVLLLLILFVMSAYAGMRHDPYAHMLLAQLPDTSFMANDVAALLDRDHDGYSAAFGFGDCDDGNAAINPGAIDWPGDGIDQNCFGGDLKSVANSYFNRNIVVEPPVVPSLRPARRKIVVFVLLDTLRADAVDYSGGAGTVTPTLADIARRSARFDHAYAQSNNTLESMPFLLHLGFRDLPRYDAQLGLPHLFKVGGVDSVGVFQSQSRYWFNQLDDVFMGFDAKLFPDETVRYRTNEGTAALALEQLEAHHSDAPLFLYVHFEALHDSFTTLMEGERMKDEGVNLSEVARLWDIQGMVKLMKQRYVKTLSSIDHAMGALWEGIQRAEADSDVLLVVTADHGEEFYEHGGLFHLGTLHEELVRVPLIIYQTGGTPRVDATPIGTYRAPATILKWLGYRGQFLDDMNLLQAPVTPYEVFAYFSFAAEWERRTFMVVDDGYKLIYDAADGRLEMYDLSADPGERDNLVGNPLHRAAERAMVEKMDTTLFYMNYGDVEYARLLHAHDAASSRPQTSQAEPAVQ